jgi:hypothetical protein
LRHFFESRIVGAAAPQVMLARRFVRLTGGKTIMTFAEACIALGAMCAFAALILKAVEVARSK